MEKEMIINIIIEEDNEKINKTDFKKRIKNYKYGIKLSKNAIKESLQNLKMYKRLGYSKKFILKKEAHSQNLIKESKQYLVNYNIAIQLLKLGICVLCVKEIEKNG